VSGHFDDLDAVLEFDALDDFRQLIFAIQSSPYFCGGVDEFEHDKLGCLRRRRSASARLHLLLLLRPQPVSLLPLSRVPRNVQKQAWTG
jgi:hypothetical protein